MVAAVAAAAAALFAAVTAAACAWATLRMGTTKQLRNTWALFVRLFRSASFANNAGPVKLRMSLDKRSSRDWCQLQGEQQSESERKKKVRLELRNEQARVSAVCVCVR
jgi:H+/Cl- antiporter ClcA